MNLFGFGLFAIINVAAFVGNLSVCYAVYRNQRLRTLSNMFVVALAISDILMSTCCMPFSVATLIHGQWIFGEAFVIFTDLECSHLDSRLFPLWVLSQLVVTSVS